MRTTVNSPIAAPFIAPFPSTKLSRTRTAMPGPMLIRASHTKAAG